LPTQGKRKDEREKRVGGLNRSGGQEKKRGLYSPGFPDHKSEKRRFTKKGEKKKPGRITEKSVNSVKNKRRQTAKIKRKEKKEKKVLNFEPDPTWGEVI